MALPHGFVWFIGQNVCPARRRSAVPFCAASSPRDRTRRPEAQRSLGFLPSGHEGRFTLPCGPRSRGLGALAAVCRAPNGSPRVLFGAHCPRASAVRCGGAGKGHGKLPSVTSDQKTDASWASGRGGSGKEDFPTTPDNSCGLSDRMCVQLAKPEGAGVPWRSSFRPAPSPRPAPRARTAARRPPRRRPPRRSTRDSHPPSGAPGGLRWDSPFYATKSRFVGQVLPRRPSCAASRSARRGKMGLTHPKNLLLCAPGGTMTPASHPRQPGPHGPVSHKPRFHGRNPFFRSHDLPFRRGRRSSMPRGGGASRPRLPSCLHRAPRR